MFPSFLPLKGSAKTFPKELGDFTNQDGLKNEDSLTNEYDHKNYGDREKIKFSLSHKVVQVSLPYSEEKPSDS